MIHREDRDGLSILRMDHGKVSALDLELLLEFRERLKELSKDAVPAVVLTGTGSSFSAGVDLHRVVKDGSDYLHKFLPALEDALRELLEFPRPVIAAINGHAIAGGCIIASACDQRIMAEGGGRMGVTELLVGVPFPALPLEIIRAAVAPQHFQTIVYTGRLYNPAEALAAGLVDEVVAPDLLTERATNLAARLAGISPRAFQITKAQIRRPIVDRAILYAHDNDGEVTDMWSSVETRQSIDAYLQRTIRKK